MNAEPKPTLTSRLLSASVSNNGHITSVDVPKRAYVSVAIIGLVSILVGSQTVTHALHRGDQVQAMTNVMLVATVTLLVTIVTYIANRLMMSRITLNHNGKMGWFRLSILTVLNASVLFPGFIIAYYDVWHNGPDTAPLNYWIYNHPWLHVTPNNTAFMVPALILGWFIYGRLVSYAGPFGATSSAMGQVVAPMRVKLFGQDKAVDTAQAAIAEWVGSDAGAPLSLLFSGPSGVGKTQLAENLSGMYGRWLSQFNMGELSGGTSIRGGDISKDKLIGMPVGYHASEKGGLLTNALGRNPNGIFLFDEMEKASGGVFDLFLNMLDKGWIEDARGKRYNCRNAIFIFTTNVGRDVDPDLSEAKVRDKMVRAGFRPELMGRINKLIQFKPLTLEIAGMIATSALRKELSKSMTAKLSKAKQKMFKDTPEIVWKPDLVAKQAALEPLGYEDYGVRVMQRFAKEMAVEIIDVMKERDEPVAKVILYPSRHAAPELGDGEIAFAVGTKTKVDMEALSEALHARVLGQDHAIDVVMEQMTLRDMGLVAKPEQPEGTFLLTGPSGTGKTELAKAFADATDRKFLYYHMGNFKDTSGVNAFFGASSGYVGSEKGGQLTQAVLDHPDAVILLDEIEKASPELWDSFMGVFDDGLAKDTSTGEMVPFKRTMIFLTSNLITADVDADTARQLVRDSGYFRPEMVNRIEHVVPFKPLDGDDKLAIVEKVMQGVIDNYNKANGENVKIKRDWLERYRDVDLTYGARDLQRRIQRDLRKDLVPVVNG